MNVQKLKKYSQQQTEHFQLHRSHSRLHEPKYSSQVKGALRDHNESKDYKSR